MNQKRAAFLATAAAGAFLFLAASCGGGGDSSSGSSQSQPSAQPQQSQASNEAHQSQPGNQCQQPQSGTLPQPSDAPARYATIDLHSSGYTFTVGVGIAGGEQVGLSLSKIDRPGPVHALLWRGSASSLVDLNPNGFSASWANATNGAIQVGAGSVVNVINGWHALKWSGSADSVVDLDPNGVRSEARGVAGDQIVGHGLIDGSAHAMLWTSRGVVDLNPSGFAGSFANATDGVQQVGMGTIGGQNHALLWSGTAGSAVDLHLCAYFLTVAVGVSDGQQVGYALLSTSSDVYHALLWTGTAQSVVNLHSSGFLSTQAEL